MSDTCKCRWDGCRVQVPRGTEYCRQHVGAAAKMARPLIVQRAAQFASSRTDMSDEICMNRFLMQNKMLNISPDDHAQLAALMPEYQQFTDTLSRVIMTHHKIRKESGSMLPAEQAFALIDTLSEILKQEFATEPARLKSILEKFQLALAALAQPSAADSEPPQ